MIIARKKMKDPSTRRMGVSWVVLSLLFAGVAGCAQMAAPVVLTSTPTAASVASSTAAVQATLPSLQSGWETYSSLGQCGYFVSYPSDMSGTSQGTYSWTLGPIAIDPAATDRNFVYISVIPDDFQSGGEEIIYNHDPAEAETLLSIQVGESKALREDPATAEWFTYARLPDTIINNHPARTYENTQPWEFPTGTKEIRYTFQDGGCTYLVGGYLATTGSDSSGAIHEELFDQIIATFRLAP